MADDDLIRRVAAAMWKAEAVDAGTPDSVAYGRTPEAFDDQSDFIRDRWMKFARAAIASLPAQGVRVPDFTWQDFAGVEVAPNESMSDDNLAVALCSYFDSRVDCPDDGEEGAELDDHDCWKVWVSENAERVLRRIAAKANTLMAERLAALPAQGVRVKPLVWEAYEDDPHKLWRARCETLRQEWIIWVDCPDVDAEKREVEAGRVARILAALAPAEAGGVEARPRRASGPIPPDGFATEGAEDRWIADTKAGVYDDTPAPVEALVKAAETFSDAYRTWSLIRRDGPGKALAFEQMHRLKVDLDAALAAYRGEKP